MRPPLPNSMPREGCPAPERPTQLWLIPKQQLKAALAQSALVTQLNPSLVKPQGLGWTCQVDLLSTC